MSSNKSKSSKSSQSRQGPEESATKFPLRESRFGNDGQIWTIIKSGKSKRWKRVTSLVTVTGSRSKSNQSLPKGFKPHTKSYISADKVTNKKYYPHDNGGRPFLVIITKETIKVYAGIYDFSREENKYDAHVLTIKNYAGYWVGTHDSIYLGAKWARGNSILVKLTNHQYISIGWNIYQFETADEIYDYHSEVGNNDVPYPIALGTQNTYFMIESGYVPNKRLKMDISLENLESGNLMGYYYGHVDRNGQSYYQCEKKKKSKCEERDELKSVRMKKLKTLQKRNLYSMNMKELRKMIKKKKVSRRKKGSKKKKKN
jgi:hypothetical protein